MRETGMNIDIDKLSEEELIDLNHRIVERLRFLNQMRALIEAGALIRIVEGSIRDRGRFQLGDFEALIYSNKLISA